MQFGGIGLSATAITWKGASVPVSEITKAELVRSNLQIKRHGKWRSAISVRSDKVPDVLVFLEVLEVSGSSDQVNGNRSAGACAHVGGAGPMFFARQLGVLVSAGRRHLFRLNFPFHLNSDSFAAGIGGGPRARELYLDLGKLKQKHSPCPEKNFMTQKAGSSVGEFVISPISEPISFPVEQRLFSRVVHKNSTGRFVGEAPD